MRNYGVWLDVVKIFDGVFKIDNKLATANIAPGHKVYGEKLLRVGDVEYRLWNPYRSKLAAAILNGMKTMEIKKGSKVLYLGAATGTTCSHVSDIVGNDGTVYCVEISERNMRDLIVQCDLRQNMLPIMADARSTYKYAEDVGKADIIYQDVATPDQAEILIENSKFIDKGGYAYLVIKSQSIDVARRPEEVYEETLNKLSDYFTVVEKIDITPYDEMHLFVVLRKR